MSRTNKDIKPLLMYFLPKGQQPSSVNLCKVSRHLHLAFKGMETGEVYDVLMEHLINTIKGSALQAQGETGRGDH